MFEKYKNSIFSRELTKIGRFVAWADEIEVRIGKKTVFIFVAIGFFMFIIDQQSSDWDFFQRKKIAVAAESNLQKQSRNQVFFEKHEGGSVYEKSLKENNERIAFKKEYFKKNIEELVSGKPMEKMLEAVVDRDEKTASYLVAIAKKESNLGKFSPKKDGRDCFNYWGFRGSYNKTKSGYSCFDSPEQAVEVVGDRIQYLSQVEEYDSPEKMIVWKCGYNCDSHDPESVRKWIADVSLYYEKFSKL